MRYLILPLALVATACFGSTFGPEMAQIGMDSWMWVVGLSMAGGIVSLLQKIPAPDAVRGSIVRHVLQDLPASLLAGMLTFFMAEGTGLSAMMKAPFITLGGYLGAVAIQYFAKKFFPP